MATQTLQSFLEDRLRALSPTIDLDPGSPAQVQFIEPVITYLGTDPFETDIDSFITDRFLQEFPNIFAGDPGAIRDSFVKPLILLLTPFKRETESIKRNQSLKDPTVLSDDDADALAANFFDERDPGGFASGTGRVFFSNPTNVQIEVTNRAFTADGLGFFPTNPLSITAEEMVFNISGTQYFLDIPLKAEAQGSQYNIDVNTLSGIDGVFGAVKVTNLEKFTDGSPTVDTPTFLAGAREALNERSLVNRRGANARLGDVFQTQLRALQVIGAGDVEMERDILVALSPGHQWITGPVTIWKNMALVQAKVIDGDEADAPAPGDTLYVYLSKTLYPGVAQASRFVRLKVDTVFIGPLALAAPFQQLYLVQWHGDFPTGVAVIDGTSFEGGFAKVGTVKISSLPDVGAVNITAPNDSIHVYGHTDFYVRPILQPSSKVVLDGLADFGSLIERLTLTTQGLGTIKNQVGDSGGIDFAALGVEVGDLLSIETGDDVGIYGIIKVTSGNLWLNANLSNSQAGIRYRVIKVLTVDPFEPKIFKFPFDSILANDLQTVIGSNTFTLVVNDIVTFGAKIGDTLRITSGIIAGDYTITGFDSVLGGRGPILDRPAAASLTDLQYEVFTKLESVVKPLVRIKELLLLDSSKQSTGVTIPYADPVGVVPTCDFTSARVRGSSQRISGFILPSFATSALTTYISGASVAAGSGDRRYSLGFDTPIGTYKPVQFPDGTLAELDYHATPGSGVGDALDPASYFVSIAEFNDEVENFPPVDPHPGECLSIKNGPNKGDYLIKSVVKFKHKLSGPSRTVWTYFIKIYGKFPVDVLGQLFDFLNDVGGGAAVVELPITGQVTYPDYFRTLYQSLGTKLNSALTTIGVTSPPSAPTLQSAVDLLTQCSYDWGDPARGVLRSYFLSPTLFQQHTGDIDSSMYTFTSSIGEVVKFRPDPNRYRQQELIPPRLTSDTDPLNLPRDLDVAVLLPYNTQTANFTLGKKLTGANSKATGIILADADGGATGTLTLTGVLGEFIAGEIITDDNGAPGSATAGTFAYSTIVRLTDNSRASVSVLGIVPGDVLSVHEQIFFHGTSPNRNTAIQTLQGSSQITAPSTSGNIFTPDMVGDLLFIEERNDKDSYRITKFIDGKNLLLDKALTVSTPTILAQGQLTSWGNTGLVNQARSTGFDFVPYIGKFITLYGLNYIFEGSYEIAAAPALGQANITKTPPDFSTVFTTDPDAHFVITESPTTPLTAQNNGTELWGLRPIRVYEGAAKDIPISVVLTDDISISQITIAAVPALRVGREEPFRIYRHDVRRVTPSEMASNTFGPTVYFDTEVVSLSPHSTANIVEGSYLQADVGTYDSDGYRHIPDDRTRTYSVDESGFLKISPRILPIGSRDSQDNFINLVGSSVQVTYEQSDLVRQIQEFSNSAEDRVTSANFLVRHFLPAYVSYDAIYSGGSAPSVIAADIISYIDNLAIETPIDVSQVESLIDQRGGNPITPTFIQTIIHDWSRKVWMEFSDNQLGGTTTDVPYDGTARVSFFIPGADVSGQNPLPEGERINLSRE